MTEHYRIAVEEAFVTLSIFAGWQRLLQGTVEPGFAKMGGSILGTSPAAQAIHEQLFDLGAGRLAVMDAHGIDMQVLSLTAPGIQVFEPEEAHALAVESNDVLIAAVAAHPTRLAGLAAVAPHHAMHGARELERARASGLCGWIVNSHTQGVYLDDPRCRPLLEAAEALDMPLYLHPREPSPQMIGPYLDYGLYFAGWGFAAECGLHAMRLIMSGTFDRYPRLKVVLGHMGEGIPFWLPRIDNRYQLQVRTGAVAALSRLPSEYFRDNFVVTTSGHTSLPALRLVLDELGAEHVLFAADHPYESTAEAVAFLDSAPLDETDRALIYAGNARRIFSLQYS